MFLLSVACIFDLLSIICYFGASDYSGNFNFTCRKIYAVPCLLNVR